MVLPYYVVFKNGQAESRDERTFKLHDSRAEFETRPRVFTTFIADWAEGGYAVRGLKLHLERLLGDAGAFGIIDGAQLEHRAENIEARLAELFHEIGNERVLVRLLLSKDGLELFADRYQPRWTPGTPIALAAYRGTRPWPAHKTTATEICRASHEYALARGAHEGLLIDDAGCITEGSWSNFFWLDERGTLYTRKDDVLPGVTRQLILEKFPVQFRSVTIEEFFETACEAFITQSSQAITPVERIDEWRSEKGSSTFFRAGVF